MDISKEESFNYQPNLASTSVCTEIDLATHTSQTVNAVNSMSVWNAEVYSVFQSLIGDKIVTSDIIRVGNNQQPLPENTVPDISAETSAVPDISAETSAVPDISAETSAQSTNAVQILPLFTIRTIEQQEIHVALQQANCNQGPQRKPPRRAKNIQYNNGIRCDLCGRNFGLKATRTQHMNVYHGGDLPFKCHCGKRFATELKLANHEKNHDPEFKIFGCTECKCRYANRRDLDRHVTAHHGTPKHRCEQCGKGFVRKDHLKAHQLAHEEQGTVELKRGRRPGKKKV